MCKRRKIAFTVFVVVGWDWFWFWLDLSGHDFDLISIWFWFDFDGDLYVITSWLMDWFLDQQQQQQEAQPHPTTTQPAPTTSRFVTVFDWGRVPSENEKTPAIYGWVFYCTFTQGRLFGVLGGGFGVSLMFKYILRDTWTFQFGWQMGSVTGVSIHYPG